MIKELTEHLHVFDYVPGRKHASFTNIQPHVARSLDTGKLFSWLKKNESKVASYIQLSKYEMNSYHSHICYISSGFILYSIHVHTS